MFNNDTNPPPSFSSYQREVNRENHYGFPNFDMWALYKRVSKSKISIVVTFHVICHAAGKDIDFATARLNQYTLALYKDSGKYTTGTFQEKEYSQPYYFGWLYGTDPCREANESVMHKRLEEVSAILDSDWAKAVMSDLGTTLNEVRSQLVKLSKNGVLKAS